MSRTEGWMAAGIKSVGTELLGPGAPWKAKSVWMATVNDLRNGRKVEVKFAEEASGMQCCKKGGK